MKRFAIQTTLLSGIVALSLSTCGNASTAQTDTQPTPRPTQTAIPTEPTATPAPDVAPLPSIYGIGEVIVLQEADLVFVVQGTVQEVLVDKGDVVKADQELAVLDLRRFDADIRQAEAALASAQAQSDQLVAPPRSADIAAANAQIERAQITLAQTSNAQPQDVRAAESSVTNAEAALQATRDQLSLTKTNAESQIGQASEALVQAQARYAEAKSNWAYVQDTGNNPQQPETVGPGGQPTDNEVESAQREAYYSAFVQAEAGLRQAEQNVADAQVVYEQAKQAEITGIQQAEQQVDITRASLEKVRLPAGQDQVASAQASLRLAQAQRAQIYAEPSQASVNQASAGIRQAEVGLEVAKLNRADARLVAPFDGVISEVNIDPGDPSATNGPAIRVIDVSNLLISVDISDADIVQVTLDQTVAIAIEGLPTTLVGQVSYIAPEATVRGNVRTYVVEITPEDADGLRPGMSAQVEIVIQPQEE